MISLVTVKSGARVPATSALMIQATSNVSLRSLAEDRQLRLTYANLAYRRAASLYTAHRMVDQYVQLYDALVPAKMAAA